MYGLIGSFKAQPDQRDALLQHLLNAANTLRDFEGCYLYVVSKATDDPDTIWITETWRSREDHQASLTLDAVKEIIAAARPLIASGGGGFEVIPVGGKGIPETAEK
jgi:quinol monooxygenase YgiN